MTKERAREYINSRISELPKARKRVSGYDTYICPFCGNGGGSDGDGISTRDGVHYKCFRCGYSGDYLDMQKRLRGTDRERDVFSFYGLSVDGHGRTMPPKALQGENAFYAYDYDYVSFLKDACTALQASREAIDYLRGRGISPETAARFGVGYCPDWRSPAAIRSGKSPAPSRRLIIPTGGQGYTARAIGGGTPAKYRFMKEGEAGFFNSEALYQSELVFIVEGAIDALSVCEAGGAACALGSTSGVGRFLELIDSRKPAVPLILSLDNDKAGREAQEGLKEGLAARGVPFYEVNISGGYKDPNERLTADRAGFSAAINNGPAEEARREAEAGREDYLATSAASHIRAFMGAVAQSADTPAIPTGFAKLDAALDGGLYAGLYVIGAISSLGKTTFILQVADQIARGGHDVLIFSLEMSRYELMAKSISRLTFDNCGGDTGIAKTTRGILAGARWSRYGQAEIDLLKRCINEYSEYGGRIFIHEGVGNIGVEEIKREVQRHITFTGNTPVVIIDYLQIIAPHDERATDKQIVDRAVLELKRLSRDRKIPVVAVSSFNRDSYTSPVNMASFKESGGVEYSSDVLLGLQLAGMDELGGGDTRRADSVKRIEEMKKADPRKAQLKVLKNRNGRVGVSLFYDYYPMFNAFREGEIEEVRRR